MKITAVTYTILENPEGSGRCTTTMSPTPAAIIRHHAVGEDPLAREHLYQLFQIQSLAAVTEGALA